MGILMVRCATTGVDFPTGIEMDRLTFVLTSAFSGTIRCPLCGMDHEWSNTDAWVRESDPSPEQPAQAQYAFHRLWYGNGSG
jgi:hypothetical protein